MIPSLIVLIGVFVFMLVNTRARDGAWEFGEAFFASCVVAAVVAVATLVISHVVLHHEPASRAELIHSLERTSMMSGKFVLGCGSLHGGPAYCYFIKAGIDTYRLQWVAANRAVIIEEAECIPRIRWREGSCTWSWWLWINHCHEVTKYRIYVPKSSIKMVFKP